MTVVAILQARASSTRLPGKVLLPILDKAMLERQVERVLRCKTLNSLIIATSENSSDDAIAELA
ncbi:spore coat protein, partial [Vibrio metoecus]